MCLHCAAYELRTWLLHYSPVVLHRFLHSDYYQHHLLFVEGIYLLLKDTVEEEDISKSGELLMHYTYLYPVLYGNRFHAFSLFLALIINACMSTCIFAFGERYSSMNLHGLQHLPDVVKSLGPLWAHSCFRLSLQMVKC